MHTPLAIINFTPDSFSDGGKFFSSKESLSRIRFLKGIGITCVDIGAQSTAPLNDDVGESEEITRLSTLLSDDFIIELEGMTLSLDTFRPGVVDFVWDRVKDSGLLEFIWNDVSGIQCDETLNCCLHLYFLAHYQNLIS